MCSYSAVRFEDNQTAVPSCANQVVYRVVCRVVYRVVCRVVYRVVYRVEYRGDCHCISPASAFLFKPGP